MISLHSEQQFNIENCTKSMHFSIVGSGIAGIATAIRLARLGHQVDVFEQHSTYGGKLGVLEMDGYRFDTGPSLFTMPQFVRELLDEDLNQKFQVEKLPILCHYFFSDQSRFQVSANQEAFVNEASQFFNEDADAISGFLKKSKIVYDITAPVFLENSLHKLSTYTKPTGLRGIANLWRLEMFKTMNQSLEKRFTNPKLVQFFSRYATYNGSDPYQAPATLNVIPHLEFEYGAHLPKLGMRQIADILVEQALRLGVNFRYNQKVKSINHHNKMITSLSLENNQELSTDGVIANVDAKIVYNKLLNIDVPRKIDQAENSSSALIFYWGINRTFSELDIHNIFFAENYRDEFKAIFKTHTLHHDPTIYINITSKLIKQDAPSEGENWFVMINVPYNNGQDWDQITQQAKTFILQKLTEHLKVDIQNHIVCESVLDPVTIESRTGSNKGSLYGSSSNDRMSAFFRQSNFSNQFDNLYFCGGSVHPGGGIPLCLLSAKIVSKVIFEKN